jgi:galactokinase
MDIFSKTFDTQPDWSGFTPGRVNLIGEHIDYNGGRVLPTALRLGLNIALAARKDRTLRITAKSFDGVTTRRLGDKPSDHWSDYVIGAMNIAEKEGLIDTGFDIAVESNLPMGSGLSSSAAITVGLIGAFRDLNGAALTQTDIAVLARKVETDFIGVPVGIMDQMAVAVANPGQALSLDTETLDYELIDLPTDYHMAVLHSGVHRQLSEGRYKIRKEECDAVKRAAGRDDICLMSDAELSALSSSKNSDLKDNEYRRARHVVSEHRRVIEAAKALKAKDMHLFGQLMNESHISMRDDFEMSLPRIDGLVETAQDAGALGSRLTGGGFGGCIVACVAKDKLEDWKQTVLSAHPHAFWVC